MSDLGWGDVARLCVLLLGPDLLVLVMVESGFEGFATDEVCDADVGADGAGAEGADVDVGAAPDTGDAPAAGAEDVAGEADALAPEDGSGFVGVAALAGCGGEPAGVVVGMA